MGRLLDYSLKETTENYVSLDKLTELVNEEVLPKKLLLFYQKVAQYFGEDKISLAVCQSDLTLQRTTDVPGDLSFLNFSITIYFPEIHIRNSFDDSMNLKECYVRFKCHFDKYAKEKSIHRPNIHITPDFGIYRTSYTPEEALSTYVHSHCNVYYDSLSKRTRFRDTMPQNVCFGNGDWPSLVDSFNSGEFDDELTSSINGELSSPWLDNLPIIWENLKAFLGWESLEGGPYIKMRTVKETTLKKCPSFSIVGLSYPKIKTASYDVVVSDRTKELMERGAPLLLNRKSQPGGNNSVLNIKDSTIRYDGLSEIESRLLTSFRTTLNNNNNNRGTRSAIKLQFLACIATELINNKKIHFVFNSAGSNHNTHTGTVELDLSLSELEVLATNTFWFRAVADYWLRDEARLEVRNNIWTENWIRYYSSQSSYKNRSLGIVNLPKERAIRKAEDQNNKLSIGETLEILQIDLDKPVLTFKGEPKYLTITGVTDAEDQDEEQTEVAPKEQIKETITLDPVLLNDLKIILTRYVNKTVLLSGGYKQLVHYNDFSVQLSEAE